MNLELMAYLTDHNRLWAIDESSLLRFKAAAEASASTSIEARDSGAPSRRAGTVAVIDISGPISPRPTLMTALFGGTAISSVQSSLRQAMADDSVRAIVLAFDTPGGEVAGVSDLAAEILAAREQKPIVSHISGLGASAGYWLASAAQRIVATKDSLVGSIGVLTMHADVSAALEQEGVKVTTISAGKYKAEGSPYAPLSDDARAHVQGLVDAAYNDFTSDVARGRGVSVSQVRKGYGEGRVLTAQAAREAGMVDQIGTLESAVSKLLPRGAGARASVPFGIVTNETIDGTMLVEDLDTAEAVAPLADPGSREALDAQQAQDRAQAEDEDRARRLRVM